VQFHIEDPTGLNSSSHEADHDLISLGPHHYLQYNICIINYHENSMHLLLVFSSSLE